MRDSTTEEPENDLDVNDKKEAEEKNKEVGVRNVAKSKYVLLAWVQLTRLEA